MSLIFSEKLLLKDKDMSKTSVFTIKKSNHYEEAE